MSVAKLASVPAGVAEASQLIARFDDCLRHGFARLGGEQREALEEFVGAFSGSPLEGDLREAVEAVDRSEFLARHFVVLAAARVALQGAQYDALMQQLCLALEREVVEVDEPPAVSPGAVAGALGSMQQWLMEMALAGFSHLEESSVAPFAATLGQLQAAAELTAIGAMATGFVNELLDHMPAERQSHLPMFRWADLWSGLMVRAQQLPGVPAGRTVSGSVVPFGIDVQSHRNFVCAVVYGLLTGDDTVQSVRIPFVSYKVDVISGPEVWELFGKPAEAILKSLKEQKQIKVDGAELMPGGDLLIRSPPKVGRAADPFAAAANVTAFPNPPALARHPVHLAEVVCMEGDIGLPIAEERIPTGSELDEKTLSKADAVIGLLRFDRGGWRLQPLCVKGPKSVVMTGQSVLDVRAKCKSKTLAILSERASKLLRDH